MSYATRKRGSFRIPRKNPTQNNLGRLRLRSPHGEAHRLVSLLRSSCGSKELHANARSLVLPGLWMLVSKEGKVSHSGRKDAVGLY